MRNIQFVLLASLMVTACGGESGPATATVDITAGRAIVEADCSGCHGLDGRAENDRIPNLAGQPAEYLVNALRAYADGTRQHIALKDMATRMSEQDIQNIAAFFAGLPPLEPGPTDQGGVETLYMEGAEVAAICEDCHGNRGNSETKGIPSLAGQQPVYLITSTQEYRSGNRGHDEKADMLRGLEQVDIEKMAIYFASQAPLKRKAPPFGDPVAGEPLSADCGGCHGERGISHEPMTPSLAGQEPFYLRSAIKAYRDNERSHEDMDMGMSDADIESIAAFYTVQAAEPAVEKQASLAQVTAKCDRCHGPSEKQRALVVPRLRGQNRDYLIRAMREYRREGRDNSMMHKMSSGYNDEMIEAIADHYSRG